MLNIKPQILNRGASIYFAIIVLSALLAIVLGLGGILVSQTRVITQTEDSVSAFFAADTGMERILYEDKMCRLPGCSGLGWPCVDTVGCDEGRSNSDAPVSGSVGSSTYQVFFNNGALSITSLGIFNGIRRALQVNR
jgi:hypothetical protein